MGLTEPISPCTFAPIRRADGTAGVYDRELTSDPSEAVAPPIVAGGYQMYSDVVSVSSSVDFEVKRTLPG